VTDTILADSYVDTDDRGSRTDKAGILAALRSGDLRLTSLRLLETDVNKYSDCAVLTGASAQSGVFHGEPIAPKILFTAILVFQDGSGKQRRHIGQPFRLQPGRSETEGRYLLARA
jgi:hypothetical protein